MGDPLLTEDRIRVMQVATPEQVQQLRAMALTVDRVLSDFFQKCGITLVDFKLEFGVDRQGNILLADEISPDTCRLWNQAETDPNRRVMDKDRFRRDLGDVESAYRQVLDRVLAQSL
jgi:phosphoribosylaminoimidazole-succinocarboxamide synthase